jgi:hypothetical protein
MARELEALAADALVSGMANEPARPAPEADCANCGQQLHGRYCSECGQSADLRHRSILHLLWEALESLLHLDGRLWRTVPGLFFRPGALNRDLLEGRIARHVPPFRMFLVALVIFVFAAEHAVRQIQETPHGIGKFTVNGQTVKSRAEAVVKMRQHAADTYALKTREATRRRDLALADPKTRASAMADYQRAMRDAINKRDGELGVAKGLDGAGSGGSRFSRGMGAAMDRPEYYITVLFEWMHRLAVLLLPIVAVYLTLAYAHRRKFYVYDHLIVAMNYLSFLFLLYAAIFVLPEPVRSYALLGALVWSAINLFQTLRGAYGSSIVGAAFKAVAISLATALSFVALVVGLLTFTLYQL